MEQLEKIEIKRQLITPSIAKMYLEQNVRNRRISQAILYRYVNDMKNKRWKENTGELIKISKTGVVLDGQHRLLAIIKANCPLYLDIAFNVDDSVFDVLDTGKSRNSSDCFFVAGIKNSNSIPSIITYYNLLEEGKKIGQQVDGKATNAELLEQYYKDEFFWDNIAKNAHNWYSAFAKIIPPSVIGGFYAHFYKLNPNKAELFMTQLCTGSDITNKTIALLRKKLMQDKMAMRKMTSTIKMALIIKTWNHYINGIEVKILKFDSARDEFPTAIKGILTNTPKMEL